MKKIFLSAWLTGITLLSTSVFALPPVTDGFRLLPSFKTTETARFVNVETPFRCSVKDVGDLEIATTIALRPTDFQLTFFDTTAPLPLYEVNGFSFRSKPVDEALQNLLKEADITVYSEDGVYPELDGKDIYGELTAVVDELTQAGDTFYRYDAERKEIYLSRKGRFEMQLPPNRTVMLAVLDALRGAGLTNFTPDWNKHTILLTLTTKDKETVQNLVNYIVNDSYLLVADTEVYRLMPRSANAGWQQSLDVFGMENVHRSDNALMGKILTMGHHPKPEHLFNALSHDYSLERISQGIAIVPNGWKMRFDVGRCSIPKESNSLSILLNAHVKSPDKVETDITLDTRAGEVSTFNTVSAIDNELVIFGIPTLNPTENPTTELLITLKLRLIRLIKEH